MDGRSDRVVRTLGVSGIFIGVAVFVGSAAVMSVIALAGLILSAASAVVLTWVSLGRLAVVQGISGAMVGAVVAWVAMRSMMRWVAITSERSPVLTLEGTSAILASSVVMSLLPGMGYVHFRRRFGPSFRRALEFGLLLSAVGGVPVLLLLSGEIGAIARLPLIPASFLLGVPVVYAVVLEATHRMLWGPSQHLRNPGVASQHDGT